MATQEKYPYQRMLKDKILQAIAKIETENPTYNNEFNSGQKFMRDQIIKKVNEAEV